MHFEAPQDLEKVGWFQSRKKQKVNEYFDKEIRGMVNCCHEQDDIDLNWS